jgi:hypothetical protein
VGDPIWSLVKEEAQKRGFMMATQGGPSVVGRRSGGGHQLSGRGAAVSSSGGRCGEGGLVGRSERPVCMVVLGGQGSV